MKKTLAILIALTLALGAVSCGDNTIDNDETTAETSSEETTVDTSDDILPDTDDDSDDKDENNNSDVEVTDAKSFLANIWNKYSDDEKFSIGGGDTDDNMTDGEPGKMELDADTLNRRLGFPTDSIDDIDSAASAYHMMVLNYFTAGAYHLTDSADAESLATKMRDSIQSRQWTCGFPEKMIVVTVDDYMVSAFGLEDNIDTFLSKITAEYPDAVVNYEEPIVG